jgi:myo-inositol 2-dehydrogenase/D-chiro-inositol 1-dehydrogenase
MKNLTRRSFLNTALSCSAGLALPGMLVGCRSPRYTSNRRIQIAQIGCGRMGRSDMIHIMKEPLGRVVAVCDLDADRLIQGKKLAENHYSARGEKQVDIKAVQDYRELLSSDQIDAVIISVPDHSHALVAVEAVLAGKHVYIQKPVTYSIAEAIGLRKAVQHSTVILQTGSQQRSELPWGSFRAASELVRNGRIGQLRRIKIGVGLDRPSGQKPLPMPVPANLDYERWLGPAPLQDYMETRVHPQNSLSGRHGWITTEDFGLGMITNWGAHHLDIAQWAMGQELGGPLTAEAEATFFTDDVWTVHGSYHVEMSYPGGVKLELDNKHEVGIQFEGDEGWVFCRRSAEQVTASDPNAPAKQAQPLALRASDPKLLTPLGNNAVVWMPSKSHYGNWLESIAANRQPIAPIQQSARTLTACCVSWISMKLGRKVRWDAATERFLEDAEANALCERQARRPEYDYALRLRNRGII